MSGQTNYHYDLFISYAEADSAWVQGYLIPALGLPEQCVITRQAFRLGAPLVVEFERAVTLSRYTILILSSAYLTDDWSSLGEHLATYLTVDQQQERLIPLRLQPCDVPLRINFRVGLDCTNQANWESEIARLRVLLNQPEPMQASIRCPYPGMVSFRTDDARFFFGRDSEISDMLQRLRHQRFLMVVGDSGSGKSSLINAGLLSKLNESTYFSPGYWLVRTMRPGNQPLQALSQIIGADLAEPAQTLNTLLAAHPPAQRFLLIIDQFEELFTQSTREDQSQFIAVVQALRAIESCTILIALRGDFFYTDLTDSALWPVPFSERLEVAPLRGEALRAVIEKPAAREGAYLEAGLVQRLLDDAIDQPGALPLVQETMVQLWDKMERRFVSLRAYNQLGYGERSGLAGALVTKANATLDDLAHRSQIHETIAHRIFLRLVQFGEGRPDTRRQQPASALRSWDDDPGVLNETLQYLAQNRLLTLSGEEGDQDRKVDIAHEALFSEWPALKERVREWRKHEQMRRRLEDWATNWAERGRDPKALLNSLELSEAELWLSSQEAVELGYCEALLSLVQTSRAAIEYAEREKEAAHQRELEKERALAAEQKRRAEIESKSKLRLRNLSIVLAVSLVTTIFAAIMFFKQQQIALSRELAISANSQLFFDPELSVLLAEKAAESWHSTEAEVALRQSLLESHVRVVLRGHTARVNSVAFSSDGRLVVTASSDGSARVWETATGNTIAELRGYKDAVISAVFSSDNRWVVTGGKDGLARVYEVYTGNILAEFPNHFAPIVRVVFNCDDNQIIITKTQQNQVRIWDVSTGALIAGIDGFVSADGRFVAKRVATTGGGYQTEIWRVAPLQFISKLPIYAGSVIAFSPDGNFLIAGGYDGMQVFEIKTGTLRLRHKLPAAYDLAEFSPDGSFIITRDASDTLHVWEIETERSVAVLYGGAGTITSMAFSPDSKFVVTASAENINWSSGGSWGTGDKTVRVWEVATQRVVEELRGHDGSVTSAVFSPDGKFILTASEDSTARLWEFAPNQSLNVLLGHTSDVVSAAFSPDEKWIVTASLDKTAQVWDLGAVLDPERETVKPFTILDDHLFAVTSAEFSPDSRFIVTASKNPNKEGEVDSKSGDYTARLWEISSGQLKAELVGHTSWINSAEFSPDGTLIVTASDDKTARIWDVATGKIITVMTKHTGRVNSATFSHDSKLIVTASDDKTVLVWEARTGKIIEEINVPTDFVNLAVFSPDGRLVVTASGKIVGGTGYGSNTIWVWDSTSGRPVIALNEHSSFVTSVAFSPDGKYLLTGSLDNTARIWDTKAWHSLFELRGHTNWIVRARFSSDGKFAVTASLDNTARVWDVMTGRTLYTLQGHAYRLNDVAFSPSGKWVITAGSDNSARIYACELCGSIQDLLALIPTHVTRNLTCEERQRFLHEASACSTPTKTPTVTR